VQYMVRLLSSFAEQFIVRSATQFIKRWCIRRAASKAPGAVYHCVDALAIRRLGETAPCAGGVRQTSDDVSAVYRRAAEPHCSVGGSATLAGPDCALHCICIVRLAERWREHVVVSRTKQVRARAFINTVLGCFVSLHRCQG